MIALVADRLTAFTLKFNNYFKLNLNVLIALAIVTQHSFIIKFSGIFLLLFLNYKWTARLELKKIPLFYFVIACIEVIKFIFINESYSVPHLSQFTVGIVYWISSLYVCWIMFRTVETGLYLHRTISFISILNFIFSVCQFIRICFIENTINPYNTGHNHPYGISTGDLINGLFQGVHLTNATVSVILIIYYLHRKNFLLAMLPLACLLLTGNNYATLVFFLSAFIFLALNRKFVNLAYITVMAVITILFYFFVTPHNSTYMVEKINHFSTTLSNRDKVISEEQLAREKGFSVYNVPDTTNPYDVEGSTSKKLVVVPPKYDTVFDFVKQSGKMRSYYQTKKFLTSSTRHLLFGAGMGGFSSKLAFNSSGVMEGSALSRVLPRYQTTYFEENHKALYAYLKKQHVMFHSESNRPFSVYNQLLGEYGVIGLLIFVVFYLWYFIRRLNFKSYALPAMVTLLLVFNIDYFIESLTIMVFFETLMFMNIREKTGDEI